MSLCRGVRRPKECPEYNTKQYDDEASVMWEFWGMRSTILLPLLPGQLWPEVLAHDRILPMIQIELKCTYAKQYFLNTAIYM